ncbi:hypothetical protein [Glaciecola sp. 1036]|uniref:hypothetical protein n=1 Tax=Alteromonadaceae TaxID=72275 RepID=UPI003D029076
MEQNKTLLSTCAWFTSDSWDTKILRDNSVILDEIFGTLSKKVFNNQKIYIRFENDKIYLEMEQQSQQLDLFGKRIYDLKKLFRLFFRIAYLRLLKNHGERELSDEEEALLRAFPTMSLTAAEYNRLVKILSLSKGILRENDLQQNESNQDGLNFDELEQRAVANPEHAIEATTEGFYGGICIYQSIMWIKTEDRKRPFEVRVKNPVDLADELSEITNRYKKKFIWTLSEDFYNNRREYVSFSEVEDLGSQPAKAGQVQSIDVDDLFGSLGFMSGDIDDTSLHAKNKAELSH